MRRYTAPGPYLGEFLLGYLARSIQPFELRPWLDPKGPWDQCAGRRPAFFAPSVVPA